MLDVILSELRTVEQQYRDLMKVNQRLVNQGKASCRRHCDGDKKAGAELFVKIKKGGQPPDGLLHIALIAEQSKQIEEQIKPRKKRLEALAMELPIAEWIRETAGVGALSAARVVAESGDLSQYANPAKLWTRFGLGRKQVAGGEWKTQRPTLNNADAIVLGWSGRRRALAYVLWEGTLKCKAESPYRDAYRTKKAEYVERGWTKMHAHKAAHRYATKMLLRDMWRAWSGQKHADTPAGVVATPAHVSEVA